MQGEEHFAIIKRKDYIGPASYQKRGGAVLWQW
jgi:hypothetical protein